MNEELDFKRGQNPKTVLNQTAAARSRLAALLETLGQELLRAVSPLFFLRLSFAEEGGEILIAPRVTGILLVEVCSWESRI